MGRIDVHSHLLPGIDDGSDSIAASLEIARQMVAAGYDRLFCTPHIWHSLDNNTMTVALRVAEMQASLDVWGIPLKLRAGGEMHLSTGFASIPLEDLVTYGNAGKYVLFDFWMPTMPAYFGTAVRRLVNAGIRPILAHPERIAAVQNTPAVVEEAAAMGLLLQCNLECVGEGDTTLRGRLATKWLSEDRYFVLGSDMHKLDTLDRRLVGLERAVDVIGHSGVDRLTIEHPSLLWDTV